MAPGPSPAPEGRQNAAQRDSAAIAIAGPAIRTAVALAAIVRSTDVAQVEAVTDRLTRHQLVGALVAAAAMLPARVHPADRLEWVDVPIEQWSARLLVAEAARYDRGDRDVTAAAAWLELARRQAAMTPERAG